MVYCSVGFGVTGLRYPLRKYALGGFYVGNLVLAVTGSRTFENPNPRALSVHRLPALAPKDRV